MSARILESNGRPVFAVVPYDEYVALREIAEDAEDLAALARYARKYAKGDLETIPALVVDRLLEGEPPLRVWREHRQLTAARLAEAAGVTPAHISKLESGKGEPSVSLLRKLSTILDVDIELLVGPD
jgi:DNA-binding XRE family transcriptional regulator